MNKKERRSMLEMAQRPQGYLAELVQLARILERGQLLLEENQVRTSVVARVTYKNHTFPIDVVEMGNPSPEVPCIGFLAGVHGVERIGSQIVLYFLHNLIERLAWDSNLQAILNHVRLVFMPMINPAGIFRHSRCNGNNVDLMRNAPVDAEEKVSFLVGGHRISKYLPWYRGKKQAPMEVETQAVVDVVKNRIMPHRFAMTVDCHSGFGVTDRIWFPYAQSSKPIEHLAELFSLKQLWDTSYPFHHTYVLEPQSKHYLTHGDIWDYLYQHSLSNGERVFLPLTLEMGSWLWVKKNPRQILSYFGAFHPIVDHRFKRVLRQHIPLFEFLMRATRECDYWLPKGVRKQRMYLDAMELWGF